MKVYFAPLEGITGYVYRRAHAKYYGGIDKYFTPFLSPTKNLRFTARELNDILPEHNPGYTVPQILTNRADYFIHTAKELKEYGYGEVNLNLGCPSGTVVSKYKGSGFLAKPEELRGFFDEIFEKLDMKISVKTRIGKNSGEEFPELLDIFNAFPLEELIIHPRVQSDFYKGVPDMVSFRYGYENSENPVCYNGDITDTEGYGKLVSEYGKLSCVMIGRGLIADPGLGENISGEKGFDREKFMAFHDEVLRGYVQIMSGDRNTLFKMKELWVYMSSMFPENERAYKKIRKAQSVREYEAAVEEIYKCL